MSPNRYRRRLAIRIGCLSAALAAVVIFFALANKPTKTPTANKPSVVQQLPSSDLTAGGQKVPAAWQAKAKRLGYYCPSWAAKPGQTMSNICLPLDK